MRGGWPPGARIYALKVTLGRSFVTTNDTLVAAWNWCITQKSRDPNLVVVNTSLGAGRFDGICDGIFPSLATAARNATQAGLTLLASAGNEGYCDALAVPACLEHMIAVGSVYDARINDRQYCVSPNSCAGGDFPPCPTTWACEDLTTEGDEIPCDSNASPLVDLLAPAEDATSPARGGGVTDGFGGTSAATPYAAGAAVVLQDAARSLTGRFLPPFTVRNLLASTGVLRTDAKSGLTFPRIDLGAAVASLDASSPCQGIDDEIVLSVNLQTGIGNGHVVEADAAGPLFFAILKPSGGAAASSWCTSTRGPPLRRRSPPFRRGTVRPASHS